MGLISRGLKNEFETAMVNEQSMFEPLQVYCSLNNSPTLHSHLQVMQEENYIKWIQLKT